MSSTNKGTLTKADFAVLSEFRYQMRRFERYSEDAVKRKGITPLQYQVLLHIKGYLGRDWATIGELADRLQAQHHGVVALITRCEAMGLVERRTGRVDRRCVEVHLLPAGEAILTEMAVIHRRELHALDGIFSVPQLDCA